MRPPYGRRRPGTLRMMRDQGYVGVPWSITGFDWRPRDTADTIASRALKARAGTSSSPRRRSQGARGRPGGLGRGHRAGARGPRCSGLPLPHRPRDGRPRPGAPTVTGPQRMSNADVAWLHMDQPTNLMVITGVLWFGEVPAWDRVREVIAERLVAPFPRFRQRVVEGAPRLSGPHWEEDPNFDLDLHLHRVALPAPGDRAALQALVADLTSTPLDRSRPLWQFHLVDGYEGGAAMIARIHHAIADGIALARVLLSLTDSSPDAGLAPAVEDTPSAGRAHRRGGSPAPPAGRPASPAGQPARSHTSRSRWHGILRTSSTSRRPRARTPTCWPRRCCRPPTRLPPEGRDGGGEGGRLVGADRAGGGEDDGP